MLNTNNIHNKDSKLPGSKMATNLYNLLELACVL